MIDPKELIAKIRQSEQHRTPAQRFELLVKAGILDKDGYYSTQYFSAETVAQDKANTKPKTT